MIDVAVNAIIRPARLTYSLEELPMSVPARGHPDVPRHPVTFSNPRGHLIQGSFYSLPGATKCVLYLHGGLSFQTEGAFLVPVFCPFGVSVFCFDFSGNGMSEGDFVSMGWFERDDVSAAAAHLRSEFGITTFALWGRSMGAGTAFLSVANDPSFVCAVADSPFASLSALIKDLAALFHIPGCLTPFVAWLLRRRVQARANFDIRAVSPSDVAPQCRVPVFIIHAENDNFIRAEHSRKLFAEYGGEAKEIHFIEGDHGSARPLPVLESAALFIGRWLEVDVDVADMGQRIEATEKQFEQFTAIMEAARERARSGQA